jgi:hypothetical protein
MPDIPSVAWGLIGTIIGALIGYFSAKRLTIFRTKIDAGSKLRAAFAPEIAKMRLLANGNKKFDVDQLLESAFERHATAIEEFSIYVPNKKKEAYYKAWKDYYEIGGSIRFFNYHPGDEAYKLFFERIHAILQFTEK